MLPPELKKLHWFSCVLAGTAEIKAAFRKRAKLLHPDTAASDSTADFAPTLLAYQVLTDARERVLYDLSIDVRGFPASRQAHPCLCGAGAECSWQGCCLPHTKLALTQPAE